MKRYLSQKKQTYRWCLKHKVFAVGKPGKWLTHCLFFADIDLPSLKCRRTLFLLLILQVKVRFLPPHATPLLHLLQQSVHIAAKWNSKPLITQEDSPALPRILLCLFNKPPLDGKTHMLKHFFYFPTTPLPLGFCSARRAGYSTDVVRWIILSRLQLTLIGVRGESVCLNV